MILSDSRASRNARFVGKDEREKEAASKHTKASGKSIEEINIFRHKRVLHFAIYGRIPLLVVLADSLIDTFIVYSVKRPIVIYLAKKA